jgi:hypothetical protein
MVAQLLAAAVGLWLMAAPAILEYGGDAAIVDRIVGPLAATVGGMAASEVLRSMRWSNLPLGLGILAAPGILEYPWDASMNSIFSGLMLVACALMRGRRRHQYGGGWKVLLLGR